MKQSFFSTRIFSEMKKIHDVDFENLETEDPYDRVEELAENMTVSEHKFQLHYYRTFVHKMHSCSIVNSQ